ncbi:PM-Scl autoantigen-like protein [Operophtera brumata]|uniref:PM-Scl autoantigen-like protein n=1 Tax=Operophtera brumata TaxID=104452 RepID=A0A0L7L075_OPEBR|nr:PM-Scl autoantigen-like protein [Operophtera brumata]
MNSVLNPEAPEFHPLLSNAVQDGLMLVNKTIRTSNGFPAGPSYDIYQTYTDFGIVTCQISENVVIQSNQIVAFELPEVKLKCSKNDENETEKIIDVNDSLLDRININIDTLRGANQPSELFLRGIGGGNVGDATFIGAKNIPRPQLSFKDPVDNSYNLWVPKIFEKPNNIKPLALNILYDEDGQAVGYEHPYSVELNLYQPPAPFIEPDPDLPEFPPPIEITPLTIVDTEAKLDELVKHLQECDEIAVDVEHHSYRSYQGITCLIQITTHQGGDFIIDTLKIREHVHKLNHSFTDPKKVKMADWRIRPLPQELITYARMDTHYLLYMWRVMKAELLERMAGQPILDNVCMFRQTYNKEVMDEVCHMGLYIRSKKLFNSQQLSALKMLYKWRDAQARELDEGPSYLIPNHMLLSLAENLPREMQGVNASCTPMPPFVKMNVLPIHRMILSLLNITPNSQIQHQAGLSFGDRPACKIIAIAERDHIIAFGSLEN